MKLGLNIKFQRGLYVTLISLTMLFFLNPELRGPSEKKPLPWPDLQLCGSGLVEQVLEGGYVLWYDNAPLF